MCLTYIELRNIYRTYPFGDELIETIWKEGENLEGDWPNYLFFPFNQVGQIVLPLVASSCALWCLTRLLPKPVRSKAKQYNARKTTFSAISMLLQQHPC